MEEDWQAEMDMRQKKSDEERQAAEPAEIERQPHLFCRQCGERVNEHRVYFGVVGPFCDVACRDTYARTP